MEILMKFWYYTEFNMNRVLGRNEYGNVERINKLKQFARGVHINTIGYVLTKDSIRGASKSTALAKTSKEWIATLENLSNMLAEVAASNVYEAAVAVLMTTVAVIINN